MYLNGNWSFRWLYFYNLGLYAFNFPIDSSNGDLQKLYSLLVSKLLCQNFYYNSVFMWFIQELGFWNDWAWITTFEWFYMFLCFLRNTYI